MSAAIWRGSAADQAVSGVAMLGASVPSFWLGLILIQFFAVKLGWFPASGMATRARPSANACSTCCCPRWCWAC